MEEISDITMVRKILKGPILKLYIFKTHMSAKKLIISSYVESDLFGIVIILLGNSLDVTQDFHSARRLIERNPMLYEFVLIDCDGVDLQDVLAFVRSIRESVSPSFPKIFLLHAPFDVDLVKAGVDEFINRERLLESLIFNTSNEEYIASFTGFMGDLFRFKDSHLFKHSFRVKIFTRLLTMFCVDAGLTDPTFAADVTLASFFHDLGKLIIPDSILNKPSTLSENEFSVVKMHTTLGAKLLEKLVKTFREEKFLTVLFNVVKYHHERYDGNGYPENLKGKRIPLEARIVAIADVFEALTADRPYRSAHSFEEALRIMRNDGDHFDPEIFRIFSKNSEHFRC